MARILLVEDDDGIARPLAAALSSGGHVVDRVATGTAALRGAADADAVLLDLGLPDVDGLEVCRLLRAEQGEDLPILVLTARAEETDVVVGLDAGADDYVTKPFRLAELQARLRALLRRAEPRSATLRAQDLRIEPGPRRAWQGDRELDLTPTEFDLLALLAEHAGDAVDRSTILRQVWGGEVGVGPKALDVQVSALRRKLGDDAADPRYLATVRGVGYRLET